MEDLKIPDGISEFNEIRHFSATKDGQEYIITLNKRLKKGSDQETFQAVTFGYSVEGPELSQVLEEILDYIAKKTTRKLR